MGGGDRNDHEECLEEAEDEEAAVGRDEVSGFDLECSGRTPTEHSSNSRENHQMTLSIDPR